MMQQKINFAQGGLFSISTIVKTTPVMIVFITIKIK